MDVEKQKGARSERGGGTGLVIAGTALVTILCAVLIGVVIAASADKGGQKTSDGVKLTKAEVRGRELFGQTCGNCHKLAASETVGDIGPNLTVIAPDRALVLHAIEQGRSLGRGEMPPGLLSGREAEDVAAYVEAATRKQQSE